MPKGGVSKGGSSIKMLEQKRFVDANGVEWLNRPGPKRGFPALAVPLLALVPGQIVRLATGASLGAGLLISAAVTLFFYVGCGLVRLKWAFNQTCPTCHHTRAKGYTTCSGCGYPQGWS
jgi:hypothetical protein